MIGALRKGLQPVRCRTAALTPKWPQMGEVPLKIPFEVSLCQNSKCHPENWQFCSAHEIAHGLTEVERLW